MSDWSGDASPADRADRVDVGDRADLAGVAPLVRRVAAAEQHGLVRIRIGGGTVVAYARPPSGILVGRTVRLDRAAVNGERAGVGKDRGEVGEDRAGVGKDRAGVGKDRAGVGKDRAGVGDKREDVGVEFVVRASELLSWLDSDVADPPPRRDLEWRGALPPARGWQRIETVPDAVVRDIVRTGATAYQAATRAQAAADAVLDSVVLTATQGELRAEITVRALSAVTRMGFLPRGSYVAVDVSGRWSRLAAEYGSVYLERPGMTLGVLP